MKRLFRFVLAFTIWLGGSLLAQKQSAPPSDDSLYDQVRLKLTADPAVNGGALTVEVKNGVVTVSGRVRTEKGRQKIDKIVRKVKGVKGVENKVTVDANAH